MDNKVTDFTKFTGGLIRRQLKNTKLMKKFTQRDSKKLPESCIKYTELLENAIENGYTELEVEPNSYDKSSKGTIKIKDELQGKNTDNRLITVKYGDFPQTEVKDRNLINKLESLKEGYDIVNYVNMKNNKEYQSPYYLKDDTIGVGPGLRYIYEGGYCGNDGITGKKIVEEIVDVIEFIYNDEKYVKVIKPFSIGNKDYSYDRIRKSNDEIKWFKVEPVEWTVDRKNNRAFPQKQIMPVQLDQYIKSNLFDFQNIQGQGYRHLAIVALEQFAERYKRFMDPELPKLYEMINLSGSPEAERKRMIQQLRSGSVLAEAITERKKGNRKKAYSFLDEANKILREKATDKDLTSYDNKFKEQDKEMTPPKDIDKMFEEKQDVQEGKTKQEVKEK